MELMLAIGVALLLAKPRSRNGPVQQTEPSPGTQPGTRGEPLHAGTAAGLESATVELVESAKVDLADPPEVLDGPSLRVIARPTEPELIDSARPLPELLLCLNRPVDLGDWGRWLVALAGTTIVHGILLIGVMIGSGEQTSKDRPK